ncbi:MAG: hypothetical protein HYY50_05890 [Candidatus Kerfeldbacteria bacterium]|nr:hypothetical protein [Candidatus Kerfeldbacteria bacterium]
MRATIHGQVVVAPAEMVKTMRRLSTATLGQLFLHAREYGSATITIDGQPWTVYRHPDHTFSVERGHPAMPSL